jgi:hypothetical protein
VKKIEGDMSTRRLNDLQNRTSKGKANNCMLYISVSQALHAHTYQSGWIVEFGSIDHMAKHTSLFYSLSEATKKNKKL